MLVCCACNRSDARDLYSVEGFSLKFCGFPTLVSLRDPCCGNPFDGLLIICYAYP